MQAQRILLLGCDGQVGFELCRSLSLLGEVHPANRRGSDGRIAVDLESHGSAQRAISQLRPHWVVNAAAYTAVDKAEQEVERAERVNHHALTEIALAAAQVGAKLIHYSTDYVFDGSASTPYAEDHPTTPLGVYGSSKLGGENAIREHCREHLILRTAWVYASRGQNFLRSMLRLAAQRPQLTIVADQVGAPTPARQIADATALLLQAQRALADAQSRWGTYHLSAGGQTTWHGFASAIVDAASAAGWLANKPDVQAITTADYPTPAQRPAYSRLDGRRLREHFGIVLPDWRVGLDLVMQQLTDTQAIERDVVS